MRAVTFLPLTLLAAVGVAACRPAPEAAEQTAFRSPARDLSLQETQAVQMEVASPVELARTPGARRATQHVRKPAPLAERQAMASVTGPAAPVPASEAVVSAPISLATTATEAPDPHVLAPGQTVTVLTASGGAANDAPAGGKGDWTDQLPGDRGRGTTIRGGRGGNCGPNGHGGHTGGGGFRGLR